MHYYIALIHFLSLMSLAPITILVHDELIVLRILNRQVKMFLRILADVKDFSNLKQQFFLFSIMILLCFWYILWNHQSSYFEINWSAYLKNSSTESVTKLNILWSFIFVNLGFDKMSQTFILTNILELITK